MAPSLDLWSRASRGTPISTLVSAPGSESMPKSPPSISALPHGPQAHYSGPITSLPRRARACSRVARGTDISCYDRDEPRLVMDEEV